MIEAEKQDFSIVATCLSKIFDFGFSSAKQNVNKNC